MTEYLDKAKEVFDNTVYKATKDDINKLAEHMALLKERGLDTLNRRLVNSGSGEIWATIAEHNFAVMLVNRHDESIPIIYDPNINGRPPDFKIEIMGITFWIQMKDLAELARENMQRKLIEKIKTDAKEIKVGKVFTCWLSDDFNEGRLPELITFLRDKSSTTSEGECFHFDGGKAEIKFWSENEISELTLICAGDKGFQDITGLAKEQMRQSLRNAVGAFNWEVNNKAINLIVMEADNKEDIDICDALFGTENQILEKSTSGINCDRWCREKDGLFKEPGFAKRVAGVIAIKRKPAGCKFSDEEKKSIERLAKECDMEPQRYKEQIRKTKPISDYYLILYMNDAFKHCLEDMEILLPFDKTVYSNMRPENGNFII